MHFCALQHHALLCLQGLGGLKQLAVLYRDMHWGSELRLVLYIPELTLNVLVDFPTTSYKKEETTIVQPTGHVKMGTKHMGSLSKN
jgi:hypothetical protein